MNVFFEKIFKSFPNRQNFKIFPQRACKHLQNTKKYVIINKLISITIKNGLMVKRLRRCPLTAESAVRFRMGLPKKNDIPRMSFFFWYTPKRNDAATCLPSFVNLRKQILAEELRFTKVEKIRKGCKRKRQLPHGATYYFVARKNSATSYFIRKRIFQIEYYLKISRKVIKPT